MSVATATETQSYLPWSETGFLYTQTLNSGDAEGIPIISCCRYSMGQTEAAMSNGVYLHTDEKITFDLDALPFPPKPRDKIQPPGEAARIVLEATPYRWLRFWQLTVRDLVLSYDLYDLCTILRPAPSPAASGLRVGNFATLMADVPCRLQPQSMESEPDTMDRLTSRKTFVCYLGEPVELFAGDVIQVAGIRYEAQSQANIDQYDTLTSVTCTRVE